MMMMMKKKPSTKQETMKKVWIEVSPETEKEKNLTKKNKALKKQERMKKVSTAAAMMLSNYK